jgi:hypothetical protein
LHNGAHKKHAISAPQLKKMPGDEDNLLVGFSNVLAQLIIVGTVARILSSYEFCYNQMVFMFAINYFICSHNLHKKAMDQVWVSTDLSKKIAYLCFLRQK